MYKDVLMFESEAELNRKDSESIPISPKPFLMQILFYEKIEDLTTNLSAA